MGTNWYLAKVSLLHLISVVFNDQSFNWSQMSFSSFLVLILYHIAGVWFWLVPLETPYLPLYKINCWNCKQFSYWNSLLKLYVAFELMPRLIVFRTFVLHPTFFNWNILILSVCYTARVDGTWSTSEWAFKREVSLSYFVLSQFSTGY